MSIKYISRCLECSDFNSMEKLLMVVLCDNANDQGYCYPSYKNIMKRTSMAKATVSKHLKVLKESEIILVGNHSIFGKGKSNNTYLISRFWENNEIKAKLINARNTPKVQSVDHSKSSRVEPVPKVQSVDISGSRVEPPKVQGLNHKSSRVEHEPSYEPSLRTVINRHSADNSEINVKEKIHKIPKSRNTWLAYANAYKNRYGNEPVRNAKLNKLLCLLVDQVGSIDAPLIAEYYLHLNDQWYLKKYHDVGDLLQNVQAIRTQWINQTNKTGIDHKTTERRSSTYEAGERIKQKIRNGEI